ncbi:hypothetical protein SD427_02755 [Chryseobacterium sp. JJR-5R]|uniref:hypothetical protein n=1 Tax=Chryseobacterium sp. JJR-5R TaxID=3093923 RepID=UPI002A75F073|nr:hypothetical protein [Chryseobacterium sp. JJR-5R]WPO83285.1 hypothetical protein SD427_02755 [Chryseobacterium sp. JJR-5R]
MTSEKEKSTIVFAVPSVLLVAAILGNLFVKGWSCSPFDFIIASALLFGTASFISLVIGSKKSLWYKLMVSAMIILVLATVWIELAVGIFGSPVAGS